jgi:DNA-binding response OmpR family regulator
LYFLALHAGCPCRTIGLYIPPPQVGRSGNARVAYVFDRQRIVVADVDPATAAMIVSTLRRDGHCVLEDPEALSAPSIRLDACHLLIMTLNRRVVGGSDSLDELRERMPMLSLLLLADAIETGATAEPVLPPGLTVLRTPVHPDQLRAAVRRLLPQLRTGTVLARRLEEAAAVTDAPAGRDQTNGGANA